MSTAARINPESTRAGMSTYRVRLDGDSASVVHYRPRALREGVVHCTTCKTERCAHADAVRQALLVTKERG